MSNTTLTAAVNTSANIINTLLKGFGIATADGKHFVEHFAIMEFDYDGERVNLKAERTSDEMLFTSKPLTQAEVDAVITKVVELSRPSALGATFGDESAQARILSHKFDGENMVYEVTYEISKVKEVIDSIVVKGAKHIELWIGCDTSIFGRTENGSFDIKGVQL